MSKEVLDKLKAGLLSYDADAVAKAAKEVIDQGMDPLEAIKTLTTSVRELGDKYGVGEIFLPELIMASDTMKAGTAVLLPAIPPGQAPKSGTFVLGTVKGDIHEIGKEILGMTLSSAGFNVIDLGKDISPSAFAAAAERNNADIVGASAIMSTTIPIQKDIIEYFEVLGIRQKYKIMVGGGACSSDYARQIGADGYAKDAPEAVKVALKLMGEEV